MCFLTAFFFTCTVDASSPRPRTSCQVGIWSAEESGTNKALPASTPFSWQTNLRARVGVNTHASIHRHQWMSELRQAQRQVTSRCLVASIHVEQCSGIDRTPHLCSPSVRRLGNTATYSIYSLSNLYYFSKLIVSVSHVTRADVWENAPSGKPVYGGWTIRDGVWQTASLRGDLLCTYTLYMTHLHSTCTGSLSAHTCPLVRVINVPEQRSDPFPGASVFALTSCPNTSCLWRPASVFSAFARYLASFKKAALYWFILQRGWGWVGAGDRNWYACLSDSVCFSWVHSPQPLCCRRAGCFGAGFLFFCQLNRR